MLKKLSNTKKKNLADRKANIPVGCSQLCNLRCGSDPTLAQIRNASLFYA